MTDTQHDQFILEAILAGGVKLPPMPEVLFDLADLDKDAEAGPREYAYVIGRDPSLAGAVFRVAGSPVFGLSAKPDTLEKAVTLLGVRTTMAVAYGEALRQGFNDTRLQSVMAALWQRAAAVAETMVAVQRALRLRGVSQDQALLLGLFHDCGVAVACRRYPAYAEALAKAARWPDLTSLDRAHQTDHAVIGQMVARNWQLPPVIVQAIRWHHTTHLAALPQLEGMLVVLLQFALHLCNLRRGDEDAEWARWRPLVLGRLVEDEASLAALERELSASV